MQPGTIGTPTRDAAHADERTQPAQGPDCRGHEGGHHRPCPKRAGGGPVVTAAITNEAVDELQLKVGEEAYAVIKASDVMIGKG
jgi:hypothetical protein